MSHELVLPDLGSLPENWFDGGQHITDKTLARLHNKHANATGKHHVAIVRVGASSTAPGQSPAIVVSNALILSAFTLNTDNAFRQYKIDYSYIDDPTAHIHWTKTSNADELGKVVRWRITYSVFAGHGSVPNATPTVVEYEDSYDFADTTDWHLHRTEDIPLVGFVAGYYLSMKVEAITPVGTPLSVEPGLFSLDIQFDQYINKPTAP